MGHRYWAEPVVQSYTRRQLFYFSRIIPHRLVQF